MRKITGRGVLLAIALLGLLALPLWAGGFDRAQAAVRGTPTPRLAPLALPDLVVSAMVIAPENGWSCNTPIRLGVRATVENRGDATAGPFDLDVNGARQRVSTSLAAGQRVSLWFSGYATGTNSATADSTSLVGESNESNNTLAQRLPVPGAPVCTNTPTPSNTPTGTATGSGAWLTVEPTPLAVVTGQTLTVRANSNLGLVGYTLTVIDNSTGLEQDQSNPIITPARPGTITTSSGAVSWTLTAARPGSVTFRVNAYGEINDPGCGCWRFVSVNTNSVAITVTSAPTVTPTPLNTPTPTFIVGDLGWRTISGAVRTSAGAPIAGASVTCSHFSYVPRTVCSGTRTTAADGSFSFGSVFLHDTDRITVRAAATGYTGQELVRSGLDTWRNPSFTFALAP